MVKFLGHFPDGRKLIGLGLSKENITRLLAGERIFFRLQEINPELPDADVLIFAGQDELSLTKDFAPLMNPDTNVQIGGWPKLKG